MKACEREGCVKPGRDYFIADGVVHAGAGAGGMQVSISTGRPGHGWIVLCPEHALRDLGVAFP